MEKTWAGIIIVAHTIIMIIRMKSYMWKINVAVTVDTLMAVIAPAQNGMSMTTPVRKTGVSFGKAEDVETLVGAWEAEDERVCSRERICESSEEGRWRGV